MVSSIRTVSTPFGGRQAVVYLNKQTVNLREMDTLETNRRRMSSEDKAELARQLNSPAAKVHVVEDDGVVCRLKILFGGEALFFSMNGQSLFFDDFSMRRAVARSGGMEHWIEGGSIRDKRAVQTKIREIYYRYYKRVLQIL